MKRVAPPLGVGKSSEEDTSGERDLLLAALKLASARAKLIANELDAVGVALRHTAVNCDQAMQWLHEEELLLWVHLGPGGHQ